MKTNFAITWFACLAFAVATSAHPAGPSAISPDLSVFGWLSGTWEMAEGDKRVEEIWTSPAADSMIGMSRTLRSDKTESFEFLRIVARDDGIFYIAQPRGKPPVEFVLQTWDKQQAVFVNVGGEDHLKRIMYTKDRNGSVRARIEGSNSGQDFFEEYAYKRRR